jgi:hypothetical protein
MFNFDLSDLDHGIFPTSGRWNAEGGALGFSKFDENTGGRTVEEIPLGTPEAKFVMDLATRERGYGLIRKGLYDMRLSPVGSPPPEWPGDDDFKPAIGFWGWNPILGELRFETNGAIFRSAVSAVWDHCRTFREAAENLQPVIFFAGRIERPIAAIGKSFWAPTIQIVGWVPRDKVPCFAARQPTVKPPIAIDLQVRHALLEHLQQKPERQKPEPELQKAPEPARQEAPTRARTRSKLAPPTGALTAAKERALERLLTAAAKTVNPNGWTASELYSAAALYLAEVEDLVKQGRLAKRGERYYPPPPPRTPLEEYLDDTLPDDPVPEL